jgi:hypothetical protein
MVAAQPGGKARPRGQERQVTPVRLGERCGRDLCPRVFLTFMWHPLQVRDTSDQGIRELTRQICAGASHSSQTACAGECRCDGSRTSSRATIRCLCGSGNGYARNAYQRRGGFQTRWQAAGRLVGSIGPEPSENVPPYSGSGLGSIASSTSEPHSGKLHETPERHHQYSR